MRKILVFIILISCFTSCNDKHNLIVSKSKMEQVLYDYHVVQALISSLPLDERYKAEMYMGAVYEKNEITKAQFDSSMVYYNRHAEDLKDIYDNLYDRFALMNEKIQLQTGNNEMMSFSDNGDTTNIWGGKKIIMLRNKETLNKETFTLNTDTSFHKGDKFILKANTRLINNEKRSRDYRMTMCLNVVYDDNKQISEYQHITTSTPKQITLNTDKNKNISIISGFFYYTGKSDERNFAIIDDIELIKIHTDIPAAPSINSEITIVTDIPASTNKSEQTNVSERKAKTIEELNQERHKDNKKIEIKSAPDKIRKNTGPIIRRQINRANKKSR